MVEVSDISEMVLFRFQLFYSVRRTQHILHQSAKQRPVKWFGDVLRRAGLKAEVDGFLVVRTCNN